MSTALSPSVLLAALTGPRLVEIGRALGISVPVRAKKERQVATLDAIPSLDLPALVTMLHRDELKGACRAAGLDDSGRARQLLAQRLLEAAGEDAAPPAAMFTDPDTARHLPQVGDVVRVRHRQYLVEAVHAPETRGDGGQMTAHRVRLVGLDDDAQGRLLEVLWELELGARVLHSQATGLEEPQFLDAPGRFGAYLATLRWHGVTATEARRFQAPFRAGIQLMNHQLVPLERALELPRANLFIADDVGLGKTIEAGLVLQELRLRQRVDFVLVACPAAICLQWRDELWRRFGLYFEIVNRDFIARRRQERGFGVNPWATHRRFIISHNVLRRPEYRDPLLHHLGERARKSLLVLDEAHAAAPASASRYAVDSKLTTVIRDVAPRFENRLFLSATPHNGHSNSFSALLELLDPQRFTRGIPPSPKQRDRVMVRRLKSDLKALGSDFPNRHIVRLELSWTAPPESDTLASGGQAAGSWHLEAHDSETPDTHDRYDLGDALPFELQLADMLQAYGLQVRLQRRAAKVVLIRLQQRLLSSVEAFCRTLQVHAAHVDRQAGTVAKETASPLPFGNEPASEMTVEAGDETAYGLDDEAMEAQESARLASQSRHLQAKGAEAADLLDSMLSLAESHRDQPDAKARALLHWIRRHQCPAVQFGGVPRGTPKQQRSWSPRRLIVFTEFADTLGYLRRLLEAAFDGTEDGAERLMIFKGGLDDADRDAIQRAFNGPPEDYPVRLLLATDAAREGVNLQGHCYDLLHYDVPWNPARLEQRNGRIDRTLQDQDDVYCHYFVYPQRPEDRVLDTLVRKVDIIQRDVGSLGRVLLDQLEDVLTSGIDDTTERRLRQAEEDSEQHQRVRQELESTRHLQALERQIDSAGKILDRSRQTVGMHPSLLHRVVDEALQLAGCDALKPQDGGTFQLPELPEAWLTTVDTLRPPQQRGEPLWKWRQKAPLPVVFEAPQKMREDCVHLHLEHPLVKRLLARFLAQGFAHDDLSRVSVVRDPDSARVHVVAFARLSLFGPGASRLHDQLLSVAAPMEDGLTPSEPLNEADERRLVERLWKLFAEPESEAVSDTVAQRLLGSASAAFQSLWSHLQEEADSLAHSAQDRLAARGRKEAADLRQILEEQRHALEKESRRQLAFHFEPSEKAQLRQWNNDRQHMVDRLASIDREIDHEPPQLEALYHVAVRRLEPVGLVFLWPTSR